MRRVRPMLVMLVLTAAVPVLGAQVAPLPADSVAIGRRASGLFLRGQADSLLAMYPARAQGDTVLANRLRTTMEQVRTRGGREMGVVEERWMWRNGQRQYVRLATFEHVEEPLALRFVISAEGHVLAWGVNPLSEMPPADAGPPTAGQPAQAQAALISPEEFGALAWILGRWQGRGVGALAGVPEFHEEYVLVDDSTVVMRAFERAPFATATDSTRFEYRGGRIQAVPTRGSARTAVRVAGDTVVWSSGVRYLRLSNDLWRALFPPRANDTRERYYEMRRMPGPP